MVKNAIPLFQRLSKLSKGRKELRRLKNRHLIDSSVCAVRGIIWCLKNERNYRDYTVIGGICLILNILLKSSKMEFLIWLITATATFSSEYLNTVIEHIIDNYHNEITEVNKRIKDIGSSAVFIFGMTFLISQGVILIPKIIEVLK